MWQHSHTESPLPKLDEEPKCISSLAFTATSAIQGEMKLSGYDHHYVKYKVTVQSFRVAGTAGMKVSSVELLGKQWLPGHGSGSSEKSRSWSFLLCGGWGFSTGHLWALLWALQALEAFICKKKYIFNLESWSLQPFWRFSETPNLLINCFFCLSLPERILVLATQNPDCYAWLILLIRTLKLGHFILYDYEIGRKIN